MPRTIDINDVGMTAFFIAYFRAAERDRADSLFDDPYSQWFVTDEVRPYAEKFADLCPEFETLIRGRLLVFRELVRAQIKNGAKQVVSVGSGFDTRPAIFRKTVNASEAWQSRRRKDRRSVSKIATSLRYSR